MGGKRVKVCGIVVAIFILLFSCPGFFLQAKETDIKSAYRNYLKRLTVKEGKSAKNVVIFPVYGREVSTGRRIITLDEAIDKGGLVVKELKDEDVNRIIVKNDSKNWVFIMAGEILTGSKQDRILKDDILLPPDSGNVIVNAYCVEENRWSYTTKKFSTNKTASNIAVRQKAREYNDQSQVWKAVEETQSSAGCASSTGALNETYRAPAVKKNIDELYTRFKSLPAQHPQMNGVVVAVGNKILCVDIFGKRELFRKLWPKLLKSYLLEAVSRQGGASFDVNRKNAVSFINRAAQSTIEDYDLAGSGTVLKLESSDIAGSALTYKAALIHTDIFPKTGKKKDDRVTPIQRQYR